MRGMDPLVRGRDPLVRGKDPKGTGTIVRGPQDLGEVPGQDANRASNSGRHQSGRQVGTVRLFS